MRSGYQFELTFVARSVDGHVPGLRIPRAEKCGIAKLAGATGRSGGESGRDRIIVVVDVDGWGRADEQLGKVVERVGETESSWLSMWMAGVELTGDAARRTN